MHLHNAGDERDEYGPGEGECCGAGLGSGGDSLVEGAVAHLQDMGGACVGDDPGVAWLIDAEPMPAKTCSTVGAAPGLWLP
ncbi:hypothetical protein HGI10_65020 [Streptomyces collinus]|uniref:Uncharacterized protein n=1 Tax=Streptomyces collinus (strain DSM 40733 / Tue 365) TaxID=1214242 RepID=S5UPA2_STRC3|nr:hypothetical protein B446_03990 [Streptomyces collinus Tu 365]UJA06312.1 hypothetical protein HGI10_01920 [Streptomyces collinus]UJA12518.1 hypothetical protein HGI10_65020 [Streptomyces collinus]